MTIIIKSHLIQVRGQAVVEVLHGHLLIVNHCSLEVRGRDWPGGHNWLGDAGPEAPRAPVHAGRARLGGRAGDAGLAVSDQLHPAAHAVRAAGTEAALAAEDDRHGERASVEALTCRWWQAEVESLWWVRRRQKSGHFYRAEKVWSRAATTCGMQIMFLRLKGVYVCRQVEPQVLQLDRRLIDMKPVMKIIAFSSAVVWLKQV